MAKIPTISPSMTIYRTFPDAHWNLPEAMVRVRSITNAAGDLRTPMIQHVLEVVAARMMADRALGDDHRREIQRRARRAPNDTAETPADDLLDDIFGGVALLDEGTVANEAIVTTALHARNLNFILVDADATIRTRVSPRTFHCQACGHFIALDPDRPPLTLRCPCCQQRQLRQEPIVFGCARCATIRELVPKGARDAATGTRKPRKFNDVLGGAPPCPDCASGHIHLEKHQGNAIRHWEWRCTACAYREPVEEQCLNCALRRMEDAPGSMISMSAFPAAAPGALAALTDVQLFVGGTPLDPASLHATAVQAGQDWADYWELAQVLQDPALLAQKERAQIAGACISNVYLLKRMSVVTTAYGYRAGSVMNHPITPVEEQDRQARFFSDPERIAEHLCYGTITEGAALVVEFDQRALLDRLASDPRVAGRTYEEVVAFERGVLSAAPLQNVLEPGNAQLRLFPALHAVEHALLVCAQRLIGNETLQSILYFERGMLLLYEREAIGRGGVIQVVNRGAGLLALLDAAADHVIGCAQGCADGCPSCSYVRDNQCHYHYDDLGRNWLPANALLSRAGAQLVLAPSPG